MSVHTLDLNLLRVFEALMLHRSASAAARELGVTSSAVSHALARLRRALGDELFVAGPDGMEPTPLALEIAPDIRGGMGRIFEALEPKNFVANEMDRTFNIGASDYVAITILSPLIARLALCAPQVNFCLFPAGRLDLARSLDEGRVDLMLGWFAAIPSRLKRKPVLLEEESLVVRKNHPLTQGTLTKERLFQYPYVVVELTGTEEKGAAGFIDERNVMRRNWIERLLIEEEAGNPGLVGRVAVTVPFYASVAPILQSTDMVSTLPRSLAEHVAQDGSLKMLDLPYDPLKVTVEAVWHERSERDRGLQWVIGQMLELINERSSGTA